MSDWRPSDDVPSAAQSRWPSQPEPYDPNPMSPPPYPYGPGYGYPPPEYPPFGYAPGAKGGRAR